MPDEEDWTARDGVPNSSDKFWEICQVIEGIIRDSQGEIFNGHHDQAAHHVLCTIVSQYGLRPTEE